MKQEVKASKRVLKLNAVKLSQVEQNKQDLVQMSATIDFERSSVIKSSAAMPGLHLSPFLSLQNQVVNDSVFEPVSGENELDVRS